MTKLINVLKKSIECGEVGNRETQIRKNIKVKKETLGNVRPNLKQRKIAILMLTDAMRIQRECSKLLKMFLVIID